MSKNALRSELKKIIESVDSALIDSIPEKRGALTNDILGRKYSVTEAIFTAALKNLEAEPNVEQLLNTHKTVNFAKFTSDEVVIGFGNIDTTQTEMYAQHIADKINEISGSDSAKIAYEISQEYTENQILIPTKDFISFIKSDEFQRAFKGIPEGEKQEIVDQFDTHEPRKSPSTQSQDAVQTTKSAAKYVADFSTSLQDEDSKNITFAALENLRLTSRHGVVQTIQDYSKSADRYANIKSGIEDAGLHAVIAGLMTEMGEKNLETPLPKGRITQDANDANHINIELVTADLPEGKLDNITAALKNKLGGDVQLNVVPMNANNPTEISIISVDKNKFIELLKSSDFQNALRNSSDTLLPIIGKDIDNSSWEFKFSPEIPLNTQNLSSPQGTTPFCLENVNNTYIVEKPADPDVSGSINNTDPLAVNKNILTEIFSNNSGHMPEDLHVVAQTDQDLRGDAPNNSTYSTTNLGMTA